MGIVRMIVYVVTKGRRDYQMTPKSPFSQPSRRDYNVTKGCYYIFIVKICYYDNQKSRNVTLTESNDLEMSVSENHDCKL